MIRLAIYVSLAILLALGAVWFADHPGSMLLNWRGWEVRMSMAIFSLLVLLYTVALWLLFKLYRWFRTDNPLNSPKRRESRRQKGLAQLDLGWSALAAHDPSAAVKHGKKAYGLLPGDHGPMRLLLKASLETGAEKDLQKYLSKLSENPNTRMGALAIRLERELSDQSYEKAHSLLVEMEVLSPDNPWITGKLFENLTRLGKWADAREKLTRLIKTKAIDSTEQKRRCAALCYSQALEAGLAGQKMTARDFALEALKNDPAFIPAALLLGRHHLAQGDKAKARKVIETTWKLLPHPDLGQFFLKLEPMESPSEKFRRIQKFCALNPDHPHSLHLLAKISLDTEHWAEAKQALDKLVSGKRATRETWHLLARLERLQKQDEKAAEAHMTRAANAPADPVWQCDTCQMTLENYTATCPRCQSFGQIRWQGTG